MKIPAQRLYAFYCSTLYALFLLGLFALLIQPFLPQGDLTEAKEYLLPWYACHAAPEPHESMRYILLCLAAIPAAWSGWKLHRHFPLTIPDWIGLLLLPLMFMAGWIGKPFGIVIPGTLLIMLLLKKYSIVSPCCRPKSWPVAAGVCTLLLMSAARRFPNPAELENAFGDHMNIVLYALNSAVHGLPEIHLYGFYPAFMAPYLRYFGLSLISAEILLNLIYFAAFLLLADSARRLIRNDFLLLGFLVTAAFFCGNYFFLLKPGPEIHDPYFAYWPVRFIGPVIGLNLFCRRSLKYLPLWSGILAAGALWFNPDSGIAVAGALCAVHLFSGKYRRLAGFFGTFALALPGWALCLKLSNGFWPDLPGYLQYMSLFWKVGYMMLPLEWPPIWLLSAVILTAGLIWSLHRVPVRPQSYTILYLSVLGIGLGLYYTGRSHPWNLISCSWPALLLLFCFTDKLQERCFGFKIPAMFCGCAAIVTMGLRIPQITAEIKTSIGGFNSPCDSNYRLYKIKQLTGKYKVVNILPKYQQGFYYAETGLKPGIANFSTSEMLFRKDWHRVISDLQKSQDPLLLTGRVRLNATLAPFYRLVTADPETGILLYLPVNRREAPAPRLPAKP